MASGIYMPFIENCFKGNIDTDVDTFKVMAVTSSYTEDLDLHNYRDDITNEASGTGYTAGGNTVTVSVSVDTTNNRVEISLGGTTWPSSTFTARKFVYYKSRGGLSSADELVAVVDNGSDVSSAGGTFTLNASTLRAQF